MGVGTLEKTWFETVFRRKPHPVLRVLGNLVMCAVVVYGLIHAATAFHSAWRWLAVPVGLLMLVFAGRGVAVAVQDGRGRGAASAIE